MCLLPPRMPQSEHQCSKLSKSNTTSCSCCWWFQGCHVPVTHTSRLRSKCSRQQSFFFFHGKTPLHLAVIKHRTKIVFLLLNNVRTDISICDNKGSTAADYVRQTGTHVDEIRTLLDKASRRTKKRARTSPVNV